MIETVFCFSASVLVAPRAGGGNYMSSYSKQLLHQSRHGALGGEHYGLFAHGCTALLIAMLFAAARFLGANWWQALLLTTVLSFTGAVQLFKGHVGYPDPVTFLLLTATIVAVDRPRLFWGLQFLSLMHHEQILFFWPWLLYWRHQSTRRHQFPSEHVKPPRLRDDLIGGQIVVGDDLRHRAEFQ